MEECEKAKEGLKIKQDALKAKQEEIKREGKEGFTGLSHSDRRRQDGCRCQPRLATVQERERQEKGEEESKRLGSNRGSCKEGSNQGSGGKGGGRKENETRKRG